MTDFLGGEQYPGLALSDLSPVCDHDDLDTLEQIPVAQVLPRLRARRIRAAHTRAARIARVHGGSQPVLVCWVCGECWLA